MIIPSKNRRQFLQSCLFLNNQLEEREPHMLRVRTSPHPNSRLPHSGISAVHPRGGLSFDTPRVLSQVACVLLLLSRADCFGGLKSLSSGVSSDSYHLEKPDSFTSDMFGVGAGNEPSDSLYNMPVKQAQTHPMHTCAHAWPTRGSAHAHVLSMHEHRCSRPSS